MNNLPKSQSEEKSVVESGMNNSNSLDLKDFNTVEDFQQFIDKNKITRPLDFKKGYPSIYNRLVRKKFADKVNYPNRRTSLLYRDVNSLERINKFIEDNQIISSSDLKINYPIIYNKASNLRIISKLIFPERTNPEEFVDYYQKFIDNNEIQNPTDFKKRFSGIYQKLLKNKFAGSVVYPNRLHTNINNWDSIYDLESAQKFIDDNEIQNPEDFRNRFLSGYVKLSKLGLRSKVIYPNRIKYNLTGEFDTVEDIQEFIDTHSEIYSAKSFERTYPKIYGRAKTLGIRTQLRYKASIVNWGDKYKTPEEMQEFIDNNNIQSPTEFLINFPQEYHKASNEGYLSKLIYLERKESTIETIIRKILESLGIEFIPRCHTLDWLVYKRNLELDFYIPELNLAIEGHGVQHFVPVNYMGGEKGFKNHRQRDLIKYNLCKEHGVDIIYFAIPKILKREGRDSTKHFSTIEEMLDSYFAPIISTEEDLITEIKRYINKNNTESA